MAEVVKIPAEAAAGFKVNWTISGRRGGPRPKATQGHVYHLPPRESQASIALCLFVRYAVDYSETRLFSAADWLRERSTISAKLTCSLQIKTARRWRARARYDGGDVDGTGVLYNSHVTSNWEMRNRPTPIESLVLPGLQSHSHPTPTPLDVSAFFCILCTSGT